MNGREMNFKENVNIQPNTMTKHKAPIFETERPTRFSRGQNRPSLAYSMEVMMKEKIKMKTTSNIFLLKLKKKRLTCPQIY
jgi:hypothetical protein